MRVHSHLLAVAPEMPVHRRFSFDYLLLTIPEINFQPHRLHGLFWFRTPRNAASDGLPIGCLPCVYAVAEGRHVYPLACIRRHIDVSVAVDSRLSRVVPPLLGHTRRYKGRANKKTDEHTSPHGSTSRYESGKRFTKTDSCSSQNVPRLPASFQDA